MGVNSRWFWERFMLGNREPKPQSVVQPPTTTGYVPGGYLLRAQPTIAGRSWQNTVSINLVHVSSETTYVAVTQEYMNMLQGMQLLARTIEDDFLDVPYSSRRLGTLGYADDITGELDISAIDWISFAGREVTITTTTAHGLSVDDYVLITDSVESSTVGEIVKVETVASTTEFYCTIREVDLESSPAAPEHTTSSVVLPLDMWIPNAAFRELSLPTFTEMHEVGYAYEGFSATFECGSDMEFKA